MNPRRSPSIRCGASAGRSTRTDAGISNLFGRLNVRPLPQGSARSPLAELIRQAHGAGLVPIFARRAPPAPPTGPAHADDARSDTSASSESTTTGISSSQPSLVTTESSAAASLGGSFLEHLNSQPPFNLAPADLDRMTVGALVDSGRLRLRRVFLSDIVHIRQSQPDIDPEEAWQLFIARAIATESFENETQVIVAWRYAFRNAPRREFNNFIELPFEALRDEMRATSPQ